MSSAKGRVFVTSLAGQLLVAMPQMQDPRFQRSVILMCAHNEEGAMGIVVNKLIEELNLPELLSQLGVEAPRLGGRRHVHFGGPVECGRGFVLHSSDYQEPTTLVVGECFALTATLDILRTIGRGEGPQKSFLALGYAGWGPGQLDAEIQANGWLTVAPDEEIVFGPLHTDKWQQALAKLGVHPLTLSGDAGHA
jgi:putative transcriptional regulator